MTGGRRRVVIVQRYITHYRVPFYELLRERLASAGVELVLVHGFPQRGAERSKQDAVAVPWAIHMDIRWIRVGPVRLLWEPALAHVRDADLVIVEQASSRLLNYVLFARHLRGGTPVAFWGHGRNFKEHRASRLGEAVKRVMTRRAHWWFAYNQRSVEVVADMGFPRERITDVRNAIDTQDLVAARADLTEADLAGVRRELSLPERHVAAYIGGIYPEKRVRFLLEACRRVRERLPDFSLLVIGSGPEAPVVERAAEEHPWITYLGPRLGRDKVRYLAVADLLLMPGLVGLGILDAFALSLPLVTTEDASHSPEIAYLDPGRNGVLLPAGTTAEGYADEVVRLLVDDAARARLEAGCREARAVHTIEAMAGRFADGVLAALDVA